MSLRVIGCGNLYRGDDAAGLLVVHRLKDEGVAAEEAPGDLLSLIDVWSPEDHLVLVDAVVADVAPGSVVRLSPGDLPREGKRFRYSSHGIGIPELIGLASAMGRLPRRVTIIGIVAAQFEAGRNLSPPVRRAILRVAGELVAQARQEQPENATANTAG